MESHWKYSLITSIFFYIILLIFYGHSVAGDVNVELSDDDNTSSFYITDSKGNVLLEVQSGGNVGIGTKGPIDKFEVEFSVKDPSAYPL